MNFFTIFKSEFLKNGHTAPCFWAIFTNGNNFYYFWFASLDKEVISKWGLLLKEFENLLEEQILPFEELDPIWKGVGEGKKLNTLKEKNLLQQERILSLKT